MKEHCRRFAPGFTFGIIFFLLLLSACNSGSTTSSPQATPAPTTAAMNTPIKHVVVIFQENVSFDHYFGTYPKATNPAGEPAFHASADTPSVNGLTPQLLTHNANLFNPARLDRSQALTCDQDHGYTDEQKAYDDGKVDKFVQYTLGSDCKSKAIVMDYFDGNTV